MIELIDMLILSIAIWRISEILIDEAGPFDIALRIRLFAGVRYYSFEQNAEGEFEKRFISRHQVLNANAENDLGNYLSVGDNVFARLLSCIYCASVWVGALTVGIYLGYFGNFDLVTWGILTFAGSGITVILHEKF